MVDMTLESHLRRCVEAHLVHVGKESRQEPHMVKCTEHLGLFCHLPLPRTCLFPGYNEHGPDEPPTSTYLCLQCPFQPPWVLSPAFPSLTKGACPKLGLVF